MFHRITFPAQRSYPPMTGGWAVVGIAIAEHSGHSVGCLVRLRRQPVVINDFAETSLGLQMEFDLFFH
jgi:hypothetical protein